MLDTLTLSKRLEAAGFTAQQAQGQAAALGLLEAELKLEIARAKTDMSRWVAGLGLVGCAFAEVIFAILILRPR
jgi:hypothetical protein